MISRNEWKGTNQNSGVEVLCEVQPIKNREKNYYPKCVETEK